MEPVPRGSFIIQDVSTKKKTISIDGFWMSNEMSNKEFREFFEQIKRTPNDTICRLGFSKMGSGINQKPIIVKGNSWQTAGGNKTRELIAPDKATSSIGFRIVISNIE